MVRASRAAVLLLAVAAPLLSACREVSQPALDGAPDPDVLVPVEQDGAWGYITGDGTLALAPQFERAYRFANNRALVRQDGRYGFIDTTGTAVIPPTFAAAGPFAEGLAPVRPDSLWGFVDRAGRMVIEPRFHLAAREAGPRPTGAGAALPASASADSTGTTLVPAAGSASYFSEGRARIRKDGKWGFVDRTGATMIPPRFAFAQDFRAGLAQVRFTDGRMGYVSPNGTVVWPPGGH